MKTRALKALRRLNREYDGRTGRAPLVVVCRADRYNALKSKEKLEHATVVTLQPLSSDQQLAFLGKSGQDETGEWLPEWRRLAETLTWTVAPRGLARVLDTPWRMALLTTAYTERDEHDYRPLQPQRAPGDAVGRRTRPPAWSVHPRRRVDVQPAAGRPPTGPREGRSG